jgi:ABC-type hemin transport system substrate-binding protein
MRATCALLAISPWPLPPAQRIVALAPSLTELMFAAGADSRLVGVARFSDYPSAAKTFH